MLFCLLFFVFSVLFCLKSFGDPSELFVGTFYEDMAKDWKIAIGRVMLLIMIVTGTFAGIHGILNFYRVVKSKV